MLTGNNGILTRVGEAKEMTEMAQLKELAEMVKYSMLMDKTTNGTGELSRNELVEGIASDNSFNGSKKSGYKVVTADEKYDVKVGADLSITVVKHVATAGKEIILTLTEAETESRATLLKVTATIEGVEEETPTTLQEKLDPQGTGDTPELRDRFLEAFNIASEGLSFSSWSELESAMQQGPQTPSSVFEMIKSSLSYYGYTSTEMYSWIIETQAHKLDIVLTCSNGEKITVKGSGEFVITTNGTYTVTAFIEDEDYYGEDSLTISKCLNRIDNNVETYTKTAVTADEGKKSKKVTALDNKPVEVPAGFYYGTSNNIGKVSTGFVITDSLDENGNSNGNEFVWIPVDKDTLRVIGTDGILTDKVMAKISTGDYAGIDSRGNTNYEGVLYTFSGIGSETSSSEITNGGQGTQGDREPDLISYDNDTYLEQIGLTVETFKTEMQENYNAMIKSIQTYGGFYVARYEMGAENGKAISKLGINPNSVFNNGTKYWYGLYNMAKTYTTSSVQSSMIWGSQYDAMLNFALTGADKSKVTARTNGNKGKMQTKTGAYEGSDCINNIYDLEGNVYEWTLEANESDCRCRRGGKFNSAGSPHGRVYQPVEWTGEGYSTHITLYIK